MPNYVTRKLQPGEIIPLSIDVLFKKVFADNNNIERLEGFIAAWLNVDYKEVKGRVRILNNEKPIENKIDKRQEFDIVGLIELTTGTTILNIELNMTKGSVLLRNFTYAAHLFSKQFDNKDKYEEANELIQLSFDNFDVNPNNKRIVKRCFLKDEENEIVEKMFQVIHIDIEKSKEAWYNKTIKEEQIEDQELIIMGALLKITNLAEFKKCLEGSKMNEDIKENISDAVEEFSKDKDLFIFYDREKEKERIHRADVAIARKEGIKEGSKKEKIEIAKNMLIENQDIDFISRVTNLTKEEIEKL